ncbi:efflux RND transporter periplasmic adaptor subunit [cf. Phormidesmis sp. LEGE 11477]|uniref:efflux RND transporter periplasmic adaptor subunit n=1 Tax=cf. Phormidesmis sp. LEGE 11477 TaxID=1828680 RepID=UPI00187FA3EF|nr:efflux RND transporter periplasmic adaptor subunit [cf. Phormidesmis sp. LEGE 11477]MBE9062310.1 efflux RND transporter periplasmic adaptor subunit [cf. Phormidesmis sp. LEGE 11477]
MNHSPESTETPAEPVPPEVASLNGSLPVSEEPFEIAPVTEYSEPPAKSWWKKSGKTLLGLGIFAGLSLAILATTGMFKMMSMDMEGHDMGGMDMEGMDHSDMMGVDGAFNATPVTVEAVQAGKLDVSVNYTGAIYPYTEVTVYPRVAGQLSNYEIYPGDRVSAGQTLATLDALERVSQTGEAEATALALRSDVQATRAEVEEQRQQIDQVQADLEYLRLQRDRFASLTAAGATPQDQYDLLISQVDAKESMLQGAYAKLDRLQAQVTSDQALASRAEAQLEGASAFESYTQITSPIGGIVQERMADPGVVVQPGTGIFKIGDYQQVRLRANVAQQDASRIRTGTPIVAKIPGTESAGVVRGQVTSIFPQTDMTTRTVTIEAVVDNPNGQLLSGQFVDMEIITEQRANALSVPTAAVTQFNGESAVWVVNGETAQRKSVTTGLASSDRIEIKDGLEAGERVITSGYRRLRPDGKVAIVDELGNPMESFVSTAQSNLDVALVGTESVKSGAKADFTILLKDGESGDPIAIAPEDLAVNLTMPMKNMAPMSAKVDVEPSDKPGEFKINTFLGMKGDWTLEATVTDVEQAGKARLSLPAK